MQKVRKKISLNILLVKKCLKVDSMKEKSFKRKKELIKAALDEFTTNDYKNASLNSIIKNAGISKGTFYYHFQDKQSLYLFLLDTANKTKWEFMNSHIKEVDIDFDQKDIFEGFKIQARIGMEFAARYPQYHHLSIMFAKEKGNQIYEDAKNSLKVTTETIMGEMVKNAVQRGDFDNRFSQDFIVQLMSFLLLNFNEIFSTEEDFILENMVQNLNHYVDFMKYGLGKKNQ
ncbi:MAG: TetR/AcrR family transcriptional regulator [Methanobacterium sp.]|jgi:AcrR family transcriptional regulator|nr:TetR/AcrR family transcriptional regulator [Methanobacterium sp.]